MKSLGGLVYLFRMELARLTRLDELDGVLEGSGLVEAVAEGLADECAR